MSLSPLRRLPVLMALALSACADLPPAPQDRASPAPPPAPPPAPAPAPIGEAPQALPKPGLGDAAIEQFRARRASSRDFVINFGEPFIAFETRGAAVLVRDHTAGQRFAYIAPAERQDTGAVLSLTVPIQSPWEGEGTGTWAMTIEKARCDDEFSGEQTDYTAWAEPVRTNAVNTVRLRGCARIVGTQQRWPPGIEP